ncbi:chemotaxis protein CheW [Marivibrio halodurans]|uniref:Chemotaxis protein CheW n=1 Tax=Marivibrio halodurans TaxID=2039722 RepID=A0A8J7SMH1_9PROT|nr:chemotaxis protein CheW [Marivibrio halodurans]MBP5857388.1 chemotaxis protein CheW [Marivibrio halodurans]
MSSLAVADKTRSHEMNAEDEEQLVTMIVDDQLFGIPILRVQDIVEPTQITPVPRAPSAIAGVLNLRGRIVTVIDLRECLGAPPVSSENRLMSVTVEHNGDLFTLLVDSIGDVRSLPRAAFDKPPVTLDQRMRRLCSGVFRLEGQLLAVLDVEKVLDEEFIASMPTRTRPRLDLGRKKDKSKDKDRPRAVKESARSSVKRASSAEDDSAADAAPLYERLGGEAAVDGAVDLLQGKVAGDDRLDAFVAGRDTAALSKTMKRFMAQVLGGPKHFSEADMRAAYKKLVREQGLDDTHFIAVAGHLADTLNQMGVPDDMIHEVLGAVETLRNQVLDR